MKIYCQNCGTPTEHAAMNKPNFCFNCGGSFGSEVTSIASQPQQTIQLQLDDGSEDDVFSIPNINKLQVDIDVEKTQAIKMEHLVGTSEDGLIGPPRGNSGLSRKELIASYQREAGSLRDKQKPDNNA